MKYKGDRTLRFRLRVFKQQFPLDSGQMSLTQRCTSSQYHANIPVESIPHHTTQNEFKSRRNSPTSLTVNKNWKLEMKDEHEQTTKPFNKLATKTPWAATWNPGTQKAFTPSSPMELRANLMLVTETFVFKASASAWPKGKRRGSSSKLTSVGPHQIQMRHNSQFPTLSFRKTIPTGFRANVFDTEMHFQPISCQYPSRKHTKSYHTEWVQVKKKFTHFIDSQQKLETGNVMDEHEQTTKPSKKLATKTPWAATWNTGTQKAFTPSSPMELSARPMLVTEVFFFKASASAWPKGKRRGSSSKLTSVRPHQIQMRHNSQFPTLSFQRTISTGFRANVFDTEMHFQPISCQYPSRKHTKSYHIIPHRMSSSQ